MHRRTALVSLALTASLLGAPAGPARAQTDVSPQPRGEGAGAARHAAPDGTLGRRASAAGTIVFVRGHDLWVVRPDGSGLRPLTTNGTAALPYDEPSISDTGVVAAMRGGDIVRIRQDGRVLGVLSPDDLFVETGNTLWRTPILHPAVSRDGSKIAYSQLRAESYDGRIVVEALTAVTDAAALSDVDEYGIASGSSPSWVTGHRLTLDRGGDVHLWDLRAEDAPVWFRQDDLVPDDPTDPTDFVGFSDTTVARDRSRVLFRFGPAAFGSTATVGDPATGRPAPPDGQPQCWFTSDLPQQGEEDLVDSPTFGPDDDSVAYEEAGDLWVLRNLAACDSSTTSTKVVDDAHDPAWSAAPLTAPAPRPFVLRTKPVITGRATVGSRLRATSGTWAPAPGTVSYAWLNNGRAVKGATAPTYRVRRSDRGDRLSVRVTVRRQGYRTATATTPVRRVPR